MTKGELREKLIQAGIPADWYSLDSVGNRDLKICLDEQSNKWFVYDTERGVKMRVKEYDSEAAACDDVYSRLVDLYRSE